jgi:hypothetical protein
MWGSFVSKRSCALSLAVALGAGSAALAASAGADAFATLERGKWVVKGAEGAEHALCLGDPVQLVRLEHPAGDCKLETLANDGAARIVQYSCPGHGYGHTSVRVETPRVATIETQGLIDGRPFSYRAVARKVGAC